ncbi:MAG TPA: transposase [Solirubrobacteraceae bacterium]|nr:transposase [Solirubrobacteraceae bacterium]
MIVNIRDTQPSGRPGRGPHTLAEIGAKLRKAAVMHAGGFSAPEIAKHLDVSERTYYRWRSQLANVSLDDATRLGELELENSRLKRLVAEKELENRVLHESAQLPIRSSRRITRPTSGWSEPAESLDHRHRD